MCPTGTYEGTYLNFKKLCADLEAAGIPGFQAIYIQGLAGRTLPGDRRTFNVEGSSLVIPMSSNSGYQIFNVNAWFGINFNGEGTDDEDWIDINTALLNDYHTIRKIENLCFHKLTVRNYYADDSGPNIMLYVFQDPLFIAQVNRMLKDMVP